MNWLRRLLDPGCPEQPDLPPAPWGWVLLFWAPVLAVVAVLLVAVIAFIVIVLTQP